MRKWLFLALGDFYQIGEELASEVEKQCGFIPTLINPRYITGIDETVLTSLKDYQLIITLEDGILDGGFGEKISRYFGLSDVKVKNYGFKKEFLDRYDFHDILEKEGITINQMLNLIKNTIQS